MKTTSKWFGLLFILVMLTSACQLTSGIGKPTSSSAGTDKPAASSGQKGISGLSAQDLANAPANPLNLTLHLDEAQSASALIPAKGGTLSATGADGTVFTLNIPAGALLVDTEIRMTPVSSLDGLTFSGGLGGAVQFEPDGLFFYQDVTLTIIPAQAIPVERQIMFGFDGDGKNASLAIPVVDSKNIQIRLQHFSGAGVGNGLSAEKAGIYSRIADRVEARINNELSQKLGQERQLQLLGKEDGNGLDDIASYFTEYENQVVKSRIKAAMAESASCADGERAIQTYLGFERQRQLLGMGAESGGLSGILDLISFAGKKCVDEQYKLCANDHVLNKMIPQWLGIMRQYQLLGAHEKDSSENELEKYARERTEACMRFEVYFDSEGTLNAEDGKKIYSSKVESRVKLNMNGADLSHLFVAQAPLVNTEFEFASENSDCKTTNIRGGGVFDVTGLGFNYESKNGKDTLKDVTLGYFPGMSSESYTITCPDSSYTAPPGGYWTGIFMVLHFEKEFRAPQSDSQGSAPEAPPMPQVPSITDLLKGIGDGSGGIVPVAPIAMPVGGSSAEGGYIAKDWKIVGGDIVATKEWVAQDPSLGIYEPGKFILFHKPGK
jgi:hypothetical protein